MDLDNKQVIETETYIIETTGLSDFISIRRKDNGIISKKEDNNLSEDLIGLHSSISSLLSDAYKNTIPLF